MMASRRDGSPLDGVYLRVWQGEAVVAMFMSECSGALHEIASMSLLTKMADIA
jgi:hypothetical protein